MLPFVSSLILNTYELFKGYCNTCDYAIKTSFNIINLATSTLVVVIYISIDY